MMSATRRTLLQNKIIETGNGSPTLVTAIAADRRLSYRFMAKQRLYDTIGAGFVVEVELREERLELLDAHLQAQLFPDRPSDLTARDPRGLLGLIDTPEKSHGELATWTQHRPILRKGRVR